MIKTDGILKELVGFESILLFSVILTTTQKKYTVKQHPVFELQSLLVAQSITTSG